MLGGVRSSARPPCSPATSSTGCVGGERAEAVAGTVGVALEVGVDQVADEVAALEQLVELAPADLDLGGGQVGLDQPPARGRRIGEPLLAGLEGERVREPLYGD